MILCMNPTKYSAKYAVLMGVMVRTSEVVSQGIVLQLGSAGSWMEVLIMNILAQSEFRLKKIFQLLALKNSDIRFPMD